MNGIDVSRQQKSLNSHKLSNYSLFCKEAHATATMQYKGDRIWAVRIEIPWNRLQWLTKVVNELVITNAIEIQYPYSISKFILLKRNHVLSNTNIISKLCSCFWILYLYHLHNANMFESGQMCLDFFSFHLAEWIVSLTCGKTLKVNLCPLR